MRVEVPDVEVVAAGYASYTIIITDGSKSYVLRRRWNDLKIMHATLTRDHADVLASPGVPPFEAHSWRLGGNLEPSFLTKRAASMQALLQSLVEVFDLSAASSGPRILFDFLFDGAEATPCVGPASMQPAPSETRDEPVGAAEGEGRAAAEPTPTTANEAVDAAEAGALAGRTSGEAARADEDKGATPDEQEKNEVAGEELVVAATAAAEQGEGEEEEDDRRSRDGVEGEDEGEEGESSVRIHEEEGEEEGDWEEEAGHEAGQTDGEESVADAGEQGDGKGWEEAERPDDTDRFSSAAGPLAPARCSASWSEAARPLTGGPVLRAAARYHEGGYVAREVGSEQEGDDDEAYGAYGAAAEAEEEPASWSIVAMWASVVLLPIVAVVAKELVGVTMHSAAADQPW